MPLEGHTQGQDITPHFREASFSPLQTSYPPSPLGCLCAEREGTERAQFMYQIPVKSERGLCENQVMALTSTALGSPGRGQRC